MRGEDVKRRSRKKFQGFNGTNCPKTQCLMCRTMGRISDTAMNFVHERSEKVHLSIGETVDARAFEPGTVTFVTAGAVVLQRILRDGRRFVLDFVYPGQPLSISRASPGASALAVAESVICMLPPSLVSSLQTAYPQVANQISDMAMDERDRHIEHMTVLARADVEERIAYMLYHMALSTGEETPDGLAIDLPMTRGDIADYLGLNTETVSRQFSKMKKTGVIQLPKPDQLVIPDIDAIRANLPVQALAAPANA